jgi:cell wall-associated NlpC family hydrolase
VSSSDVRTAIVAEARSWVGTPYHHHGRIKGAGVDCAQILLAIYADALGLVPAYDVGQYSTQWHLHRSEEVYRDWLMHAGAHLVEEPQPGDIALFRFGRTYSHSGIHTGGGLVVHAYAGSIQAVVETALTEEPLASKPVEHWSIF